MLTDAPEADPRSGAGPHERRSRPTDRLLAAGLGLLSAVLAIAIPFLPVVQNTATVSWPNAVTGTAPVNAPLVAYRPERLDATIDCAAIRSLDDRTPGGATVLSTTPVGAPDGDTVRLRVAVADGTLTLDNRGQRIATAPLPPPGGACALRVTSDSDATAATLAGTSLYEFAGDGRPQVTGLYSDLDERLDPMGATSVRFDTDNRYDSDASVLKLVAGGLAIVALFGSLFLLRRIDDADARRVVHGRRLAVGLRGRDTARDAVVVAVLVAWALIGSMTSDDGYILDISRGNDTAGYIGNYHRWFDVPEAPFGWFYQLYSLWSGVSESVLWLRVPALAMGVASWFLISRALLPRLGTRVRRSRSAGWAAAGVFLCFWLPFNNGLRPETVVVIAALVSFVMLERALATRRLLPVAGALVAGAFAVAATPTGLIALAPFLAAARPLLRLFTERVRRSGWAATFGPLLAAGLIVLAAVFGDQTVATVAEATRVRQEIGPNLPWYQELARYDLLFSDSRDGSMQRRFPVLLLWLCMIVCTIVLLRRGRIPGAALGFSRRLLTSTALSFAVLALTPTKWTHHFGAFAALAAGVAALAALATSTGVLRSRRNQALFLAAVLAVTALAFRGPNTWWYVSNWGVPWFDKPVSVNGVQATTLLLVLAFVSLVVAGVEHLRSTSGVPRPVRRTLGRRTGRIRTAHAVRLGSAPIAVMCAFMVLFQIASLAKGMEKQAGSYSLGADVLTDPTGADCGLAGRIRVETDPDANVLPPAPEPAGVPDAGPLAVGFSPTGLPPTGPGSLRDNTGDGDDRPGVTGTGPLGGPVTGSWSPNPENVGEYRSGWYALPAAARDGSAPLVLGVGGTVGGGNTVTLQFARDGGIVDEVEPGGAVTTTSDYSGGASGGQGWRDLRLDLTGRPAADADRVRVVVTDVGIGPSSWVAVAQPRVPRLTPLTALAAGRTTYLDWATSFVHPCLQRFGVHRGIADVPAFRMLADPQQRTVADEWGRSRSGGPQGWLVRTGAQRFVPSYLPGEWDFDWGQIRLVEPYDPRAVPAPVQDGTRTMWGWQQVGRAGDPSSDPAPLPG
ncbi:arabinosyltransferase domain-containing protein [Pseudonocardia spirodelae]|uniref:Arabinosyltransferase domain-containing protein n=1 Tax=Pseudonocardia spirodelae TaxID=3133431 RepID=A0ABU8T488_9PSEU